MLDLFNIAKPQNCDIQTFYGFAAPTGVGIYRNARTWVKPRGVSHVYMLLIGAGGNGDGANGGGSGAVTVWYGAAQHVPDNLSVSVGGRGDQSNTRIHYRGSQAPASANLLLEALGTSTSTGATAMPANYFTASGFFQSVAGQDGSAGGVAASTTTFLSGGGTGQGRVIANYGYDNTVGAAVGVGAAGFFQMQPIIVGVGGAETRNGGVGCGGGFNSGLGGQGLVLIASW